MLLRITDTARRIDEGHNALSGTTLVAGSPDAPVAGRRVQLLRSTAQPVLVTDIRSTAGGVWEVSGLRYRPPGDGYTVIAYDHTGVHDPVAKGNLVPTPMPPDPAEHV